MPTTDLTAFPFLRDPGAQVVRNGHGRWELHRDGKFVVACNDLQCRLIDSALAACRPTPRNLGSTVNNDALKLADKWLSVKQREADRRNSAYDYYGMGNTPQTVDPLGSDMAAELRRQHARVAELEAQVEAVGANPKRRAAACH